MKGEFYTAVTNSWVLIHQIFTLGVGAGGVDGSVGDSWRTCNGEDYFPGVHPTLSLEIHLAENAILSPCEVFCSHTFLCRNSNLYKHHTVFQYICTHGNENFFLENCSLCKTKRFLDMCHVY